jgi:hypothetical protein
MIVPELNNLVDDMNKKYKMLIDKQKRLKKINDDVLSDAKNFLELKKNENLAFTKKNKAIITKDGIMVSKNSTRNSNQSEYCSIEGRYNDTLPKNRGAFDKKGNVYNGGNSFDLSKPCNNFNDLVEAGLDEYSFDNGASTDVLCKQTNNNLPKPKIDFNERCKQNHFEICQSMAKLHRNSNSNPNKFGVIDDPYTNKCYCYVGDEKADFGKTVEPKMTEVTVHKNTKILALMMDGSVMTYNTSSIHDTHDGIFNEYSNLKNRRELISPANKLCNKYTGSMPYDYQIEFDTSHDKCALKS